MCPVALSDAEWEQINSTLYNSAPASDRVRNLPFAEMMGFGFGEYVSSELLSQLRLSRAAFHDAANFLANARYALGQAVGVRKYYFERSTEQRDNDHLLGDIRSRFYADYVPLLQYSAVEHTIKGLSFLYNLDLSVVKARKPHIDKIRLLLSENRKDSSALVSLDALQDSPAWIEVVHYRNDWVHNEPKKIETTFYSPRRNDYIEEIGDIKITTLGPEFTPDYLWDDIVELFNTTQKLAAELVSACADDWEQLRSEPQDF